MFHVRNSCFVTFLPVQWIQLAENGIALSYVRSVIELSTDVETVICCMCATCPQFFGLI